ncbi:MAG: HigA family addiction module antidote protein [Moorea sp. SIO3I7]|uniref:HigA family addiction module antitoxin n=1 Tax=unclassified Moorena TaxID=2683338 RepID=UPI0013C014CB|nr:MULTISPECIES: HigA family addiction module antitoxin [unclassified Moorena]NEN94809.1 HigA family addiction module antidote protein [Moorena sp. SIO3I7]NEO08902.1 HigA family addiction module antidote protein [Moorena sp. SIO3I8]NEO21706.1 HigA family addiction module antidote protein [Moorena sp. SIO4A5]NEP21293.1 HigA family addiction module antidote protein [Moorena sp. SIO3I6]NEQ58355.1 HigA family addiction module antidote protein [Moorena sp. SIO4A1]
MTNSNYTFEPDWVSPPGETIADLLEERDWTQAALADRLGYTPKHLSQLVNGKAPITKDTAVKLSRVLGSTEGFWLEREAQYRAALAKIAEAERLESWVDWLDEFPVKELQKAGQISDCRLDSRNKPRVVQELLQLFGVASPDQWRACYGNLAVSFRRSRTGQDNTGAITTWMRLGEIKVEKLDCPQFNRAKFEKAVQEIRKLTVLPPEDFLPRLQQLCFEAGVLWVLVEKIPAAGVSGLARWLNPHRPLIQMSLYGKTNDRFWFTFFHEAAHIILHDKEEKNAIFLDEWNQGEKLESEQEREANEQARDWLIPAEYEEELYYIHSKEKVKAFSDKLGIHPGIVVGRLQHEEKILYNQMNDLKHKLTADLIQQLYQPNNQGPKDSAQTGLDADKNQYNESDYENLLQYITDNLDKECKRSLGEFRGIAPKLLEGQDAQEWVNNQRDQWAEREKVWR